MDTASTEHQPSYAPVAGASKWPLLPPLVKFLQGFHEIDLEETLFPDPEEERALKGGSKADLLISLLSFLTVYDFQKLRRLSSAFWARSDGTGKQSSLPLFKQAALVQTYLLSIGNMCAGHPHHFRAVFYFD